MAINTRYAWTHGLPQQCRARSTSQTVYLHENGHVAGLGHSTDVNAVMYPSLPDGPLRSSGQDDRNGIAALY